MIPDRAAAEQFAPSARSVVDRPLGKSETLSLAGGENSMENYVRYCPDCDEEYQPHLTRCIDCGGALEDRREGDSPARVAVPEVAPNLPPGDYRLVVDNLSAATVEPLVRLLVEARIPVRVESRGYSLGLSARLQDHPAVLAILEREGVVPPQPDATTILVALNGGSCPACDANIPPETVECPECGLLLGGGGCESCGAELAPTDPACPACGHAQDPGEGSTGHSRE